MSASSLKIQSEPVLPSRFRLVSSDVLEQRPRSDLGETGQQLLRNEAKALAQLDGCLAPKLIEFVDGDDMVLRRQFVPGPRLYEVAPDLWPDLLGAFAQKLKQVHARGLVHGDLRPENLIATEKGLIAIDWEHALPMAVEIAPLSFRATTPGFSHPRLIWGRGRVDESLDQFPIYQMLGGENPLSTESEPVMF